jgi:hypothetical protein
MLFAKPLGKPQQQTHPGLHIDIFDNCRFIWSFRRGLHRLERFLQRREVIASLLDMVGGRSVCSDYYFPHERCKRDKSRIDIH